MMFTLEERKYLYKFFKSVNFSLSRRMLPAVQPDEEHLTSTLCELLDERLETLHNLEYGYSLLAQDLQSEFSAHSIDMELQINQHYRQFESRFSYSDIGVVINDRDTLTGDTTTRAILLQAKRLFADSGTYLCTPKYQSFDMDQLNGLMRLPRGDGFRPWNNCCYYLFYNPIWGMFSDGSRPELAYHSAKRFEAQTWGSLRYDSFPFQRIASLFQSEGGDSFRPDIGMLVLNAESLYRNYFGPHGRDEPIQAWSGRATPDDFTLRPRFSGHKPDFKEIYATSKAVYFAEFMSELLTQGGCSNEHFVGIASGLPPDRDAGRAWATRYTLRIDIETPRRLEQPDTSG